MIKTKQRIHAQGGTLPFSQQTQRRENMKFVPVVEVLYCCNCVFDLKVYAIL